MPRHSREAIAAAGQLEGSAADEEVLEVTLRDLQGDRLAMAVGTSQALQLLRLALARLARQPGGAGAADMDPHMDMCEATLGQPSSDGVNRIVGYGCQPAPDGSKIVDLQTADEQLLRLVIPHGAAIGLAHALLEGAEPWPVPVSLRRH